MARTASHYMTSSQVSLHWPPARGRHGFVTRLLALIRLWRRRMGERGQLARLDERALRDIGRSRGDAYHEAGKWFWQE
jgi:uncharacterized protein YjiS (DUF1127 family)